MNTNNENKRTKLQMLQNTIDRMSEKESIFKGFAITADVLMIDLLITYNNLYLLLVSIGILILLWGHSLYFLKLEKTYRIIYKHDSNLSEEEIDFNMEPILEKYNEKINFKNYFFSKTLLLFYGPLIVINLLVFLIFRH